MWSSDFLQHLWLWCDEQNVTVSDTRNQPYWFHLNGLLSQTDNVNVIVSIVNNQALHDMYKGLNCKETSAVQCPA